MKTAPKQESNTSTITFDGKGDFGQRIQLDFEHGRREPLVVYIFVVVRQVLGVPHRDNLQGVVQAVGGGGSQVPIQRGFSGRERGGRRRRREGGREGKREGGREGERGREEREKRERKKNHIFSARFLNGRGGFMRDTIFEFCCI
jgi:hypothetical protein